MSRNFELLQRAERERQVSNRRRTGPEAAAAKTLVPLPAGAVAVAAKRVDVASEIARMVHAVFVAAAPIAPRVVVFAPVDEQCARAAVCARAAEVLAARAPGSVCVVDANFASPRVHDHFEIPNEAGLAEALHTTEPIAGFLHRQPTLSVLPAGNVSVAWSDMLLSEAVAWRLSELREQFEYVLVDVPPMAAFPHAQYLGRLADGLVMVVEANSTRREMAVKLKHELEQADVRLLGAVLNNRTFPIPEALYKRL